MKEFILICWLLAINTFISESFAKDDGTDDTKSQLAPARTKFFGDQAHSVMAEWYSIDPKHDIQMQQQNLADDDLGQRLNLKFISDDQMPVNGVLYLPEGFDAERKSPLKLALMMHPMGSDHSVWFTENSPIKAHEISRKLRQKGYAILSLDARRHGERKVGDIGLRELIGRAHSPNRRLYNDMIIGTVRDYRLVLGWMSSQWQLSANDLTVIGYSMGAQMSLLLASYEPSIKRVISMVPPYVDHAGSPVAPRHHVARISHAKVLFLAAEQDPYSSMLQNQQVFDLIGSQNKMVKYFNSGHVLSVDYLDVVKQFIDDFAAGES